MPRCNKLFLRAANVVMIFRQVKTFRCRCFAPGCRVPAPAGGDTNRVLLRRVQRTLGVYAYSEGLQSVVSRNLRCNKLFFSVLLLCSAVGHSAFGRDGVPRPSITAQHPTVATIEPPESGFFSQKLDFHGIAIKAHHDVSPDALYAAYDRLELQLKNLPDVTTRLAKAGAELQIIGRDQVTSDLPDYQNLKGKHLPEYNGQTVDERTRGLGGLHTSCGEENLLRLEKDRYRGRDICLHEFAHNIRNNGLTPENRVLLDEQYQRSLQHGLWKNSYAATNPDEFFAELTMWYFGTHGDLGMEGPKPEDGPAGLKKYDPEAYERINAFYQGRPLAAIRPTQKTATLGLEQGFMEFTTPDFTLKLVKESQTVAALQPKGGNGFDFTPADRLTKRSTDGFYHLGDLTLRLRVGIGGEWTDYSTAKARKPVTPLTVTAPTLAAADLSPTLPSDCPLQITRAWIVENDRLTLRFTLKNSGTQSVQIGSLGIPMVFNNIITERSLEDAHAICSFSDPYIGQDAGYLQVTRLSGHGPALVVVPEGKTPFEAYQLLNEPMRPEQTFEGMFAWMVHSQAYAEKEWSKATPWNPPTMATLTPGETRTYGVRFLVSPEIRDIEKTLTANQRPVAVGIPGYVLPMDQKAHLFLNYPHKVATVSVEPQGAIQFHADAPTKSGWKTYTLQGKTWGRARLTITYDDSLTQSVSYYVIKPSAEAVSDLGHFLLTKQWFDDEKDPFHRSPSVISYDREANKQVAQDSRVWIAGLGDEAGSGSWLAAALKLYGEPDQKQVTQYEQFIDKVLWGGIQFKDGPNQYGVRKSVFFYDPKVLPDFPYDSKLNWKSWTSWSKQASEDIGRGYNYPHVVAAYWSLYQVARNNPGIVTAHPWNWYLEQAYQTTKFTFSRDDKGERKVGWVELGLMEGDIFLAVLKDLQHEGWTEKAADVEKLMKERTDRWKGEAYPFGSEMAWDSTGQEEVYAWCKYFGFEDKAQVSLNSIIGYMPTLPHWGYNGNARRYWDFLYGGKLSRIERQIHHYGSGINAIPALSEYREHPDDYYLLRIGYGGTMGALSNIDQEGFASAAFHSFPSTLHWDAYSGDYGPNFFGHALNTATYIIDHPEFGWQSFGGNTEVHGDWVRVSPLDSFRRRIYIAPRGLYLTLDAGMFESVEINTKTHSIRVGLGAASAYAPKAVLRIEQPAKIASIGVYHLTGKYQMERGGHSVPLQNHTTWVDLNDAM